ncbi:MAG: autotransporter domain-containing protein [Pseudomonadota bacterium]
MFRKTAFAALIGVGFISSNSLAEELRFDRLFVIGDSLSDAGTYSQAAIAGGAPAGNTYRFTTNALDGSSLTYAELLAGDLGIPSGPNIINGVPAAGVPDINSGGTNFAQGGARVTDPSGIGNSPLTGITTVPAVEQVDRLLASNPAFTDNDLFILWAGNNDVIINEAFVAATAITGAIATANVTTAAQELAAQVKRLKAAGAKTVIVVTVPDIGNTPLGAAPTTDGELLSSLSSAFNSALIASLGGTAPIVDSGKLLNAVIADPVRYGFTAVNAATQVACPGSALSCIQGVNASADSETRVFADPVHPTAAAHALFAEAALAGLRAATQTGAISVATMTALRQQALSLENRLNPTVLFDFDEFGNRTRREVGDVDIFGSIEGGFYSADSQQITPEIKGTTQVLKVGFDVPVMENATVGAGLSFDNGQVEFGNNGEFGGFDSRLVVGALFGQMALHPAFYVNAAVGGGLIDVHNIDRRFTLGPSLEAYDADTSGTFFFARGGAGGFLPIGEELLLNPFAQFTHEVVKIDGFTETSGAASLSFGETEYTSNRVSAGLSMIYSPEGIPDVKFNFRGSAEHDLKDDDLFVSLGPDAQTLGEVSAPRPDRTWGYLSGAAAVSVGPGSFISLSGSASVGLNGTTGLVGALTFKTTF